MKVLLDNCVPRPFERFVTGHEASHCSRHGWERLKNGKLLSAAEDAGFAALITVDAGVEHQQNLVGLRIAIVTLRVPKNDIPTLQAMTAKLEDTLSNLQPGSCVSLAHPDFV